MPGLLVSCRKMEDDAATATAVEFKRIDLAANGSGVKRLEELSNARRGKESCACCERAAESVLEEAAVDPFLPPDGSQVVSRRRGLTEPEWPLEHGRLLCEKMRQ